MKKICFPFVGDKVGGSHIIAIDIIKSLKEKKNKTIIVLHKKGKLFKYLKKNKISCLLFPIKSFEISKKNFFFNFFTILKIFFKIIFFIKKNKIDVVHTNSTETHLLWLFPTKFLKCKIFWHLHARFPSWPLFNIFSKKVDKIIAISNYVLESIPSNLRKKTFLINNAIRTNNLLFNKEKNSLKLKKKLGVNKKTKIVLFLANFYKRKQPFIFIKVAKKILNFYKKKILFLMVGDDREISREILIKEIKKLNLHNHFCLYKFQNDSDIIISGSDVLLATSIKEPFGLTLIEAMNRSTPVIASESGGHKEIIINNYNGVLVDKNNIDMFARKTVEILDKIKFRNSIVKNAGIYIKRKNNFNLYLKKLLRLYNH